MAEITISPCRQCGECCNRYIRITPEEARAISKALNKPIEEFAHPIFAGTVYELEHREGKCIFLNDNRCLIHNIKPFQCKTYPIIYNELALLFDEFKGILGDYLIFSCRNGHTKMIAVNEFLEKVDQRIKYLMGVYGVRSNK